MIAFLSSNFFISTAVGYGGVFVWLLATWMDPNDERITTTLRTAFVLHSTPLVIASICYVTACASIEAADPKAFKWWTAALLGYGAQSLMERALPPKKNVIPGGKVSEPDPPQPKGD